MKQLKTFLPFVLVGVVLFLAYRFFFKKNVKTLIDNQTLQQGEVLMSNGMTYVQVASNLVDLLFTTGFAGYLFKNTDEKALGELLLTVNKAEYRHLESVYNALKLAKLPKVTLSRGGTLSEDLNGVFNAKEKALYVAHLF